MGRCRGLCYPRKSFLLSTERVYLTLYLDSSHYPFHPHHACYSVQAPSGTKTSDEGSPHASSVSYFLNHRPSHIICSCRHLLWPIPTPQLCCCIIFLIPVLQILRILHSRRNGIRSHHTFCFPHAPHGTCFNGYHRFTDQIGAGGKG